MIPAVYVNLADATDRRAAIEHQLVQRGCDPVVRVEGRLPVGPGPRARREAIRVAMLEAVGWALQLNYPLTLIVQDDAQLPAELPTEPGLWYLGTPTSDRHWCPRAFMATPRHLRVIRAAWATPGLQTCRAWAQHLAKYAEVRT